MAAANVAVAGSAGLVPVGEGIPIGSWSQRFEGDVGTYDQIRLTMVYGGIIEEATTFSASGWAQTAINADATEVVASGPAVANLRFDVHFAADLDVPLQFTYQALLNGQEVDYAIATWGPGWTVEADPGRGCLWIPPPPPVPEPLTMVSGFLAVCGLGAYVRRKMRVPAPA